MHAGVCSSALGCLCSVIISVLDKRIEDIVYLSSFPFFFFLNFISVFPFTVECCPLERIMSTICRFAYSSKLGEVGRIG